MPIYEYEPADHDCLICEGKFEIMQGIKDAPFKYCPTCGLAVRRIVSSASFKLDKKVGVDKAGDKGFASYKRLEKGVYEKIAGEGVDMIVDKPKEDKG